MNRIIQCRSCKTKNRIPASYPASKRPVCGKCSSILGRESDCHKEKDDDRKRVLSDIKNELNKIRNYKPKVGIFGDTGVGKSSLCNALFGKDVAKVNDIEACTRQPQEVFLNNGSGKGITLVDVPGVGEDPRRHEKYIKLYKSLSKELDLILWAIKADDRKYQSSIDVYKKILEPNLNKCPVVFIITQSDKVEPYREWDSINNKPGLKQLKNLNIKKRDISQRFGVEQNTIIAISSSEYYNLSELVHEVVEVLPNQKKYSFVRETKDENVSENTSLNAEKGIIDYIKEYAGEFYEAIKEPIKEIVIDSAKKYAGTVVKKAISWVAGWFS